MTTTTPTTPDFSVVTHNGTFTITNPGTGQHRTFRIRTQPEDANFAPGERILALLVGGDTTDFHLYIYRSAFRGFAFVNGDRIVVWRRHRSTEFERLARLVEDLDIERDKWGLAVEWSAKCRRCNRELTTPESLAIGIGPICSGME